MSEPEFLRITSFQVQGLFGHYNHLVNLNAEDRVTILHGPNGIGKTKLLQMVSWLLTDKLQKFENIPFEHFEIKFSNGAKLSITKGEKHTVRLISPTGAWQQHLPQVGISAILHGVWKAPDWLLNYCSQVHCLFIETQRLLRFDYPDDGTGEQPEILNRVEDAANDLSRIVSDTMARYGRESQTLDQTYPQRVLAKKKSPIFEADELKQRLQSLERKQNALKELGLLDQSEAAPSDLSELSGLNETERRAMTLYVTDTEKKLAVLTDFAQRVRLLLQVSPKFLRKRIRLDREKGLTAENDQGQPLTLDMLSSGEQHELVLHFDLLFGIRPNTLVLIDEPELSLHVTWQKQFLPNLLEIAKTVGIDVAVATHSPFIIGDRADLMVALEDEKNPGVIEAEIRMSRTVHKGSFLLVEEDDEIRFFRPRIAAGVCELIDCRGKPNAYGAISRLDRSRFRGALAVVDDDFDTLETKPALSRNLVATDAHDLECLLLRSRALEAILAEYGEATRIQAFEQQHNQTVRAALLERGLVFGRLRWLAVRHGWPIDFKPLRPARFFHETTWSLDRQALFAEAVRLGMPLSVADLNQAQEALPAADPWRICQGHDLVDILVIGLKGVLGKSENPGRDSVGKLLRQSLDRADFASTGLHAGINTWERDTPPYTVLLR